MVLDISCPICGEAEKLTGRRRPDHIDISCASCGQTWARPTAPRCAQCGGDDLQEVPLAIVERSRGTQLSVVGIRIVHLCSTCDAAKIAKWQANRPNPLLPDELPTAGGSR